MSCWRVTGGNGGRQDQRRGQHRALRGKVQFGQPHGVQPHAFGGIDLLKAPESQLQELRGREISMIFQSPRTALNPIRPVGLQIIGNYFDEGRLLAVADRYQQVTDWHTKAPQL